MTHEETRMRRLFQELVTICDTVNSNSEPDQMGDALDTIEGIVAAYREGLPPLGSFVVLLRDDDGNGFTYCQSAETPEAAILDAFEQLKIDFETDVVPDHANVEGVYPGWVGDQVAKHIRSVADAC